MKQLMSYEAEFLEKRKFQQNDEDKFALQFVKALLVFCILFIAYNVYAQCDRIVLYVIPLVGIGFAVWRMIRLKKSIESNQPVEED